MRSFLIYLGMVGVPVLGLAGILRLGRDLRAPASVGGEWRLEQPFPGAPTGARTLVISQSGPHLSLTIGGRGVRGTLRGDTVTASADATDRSACGEADVMRAVLDRSGAAPRLVGGAGCPRAPFTAVRVKR